MATLHLIRHGQASFGQENYDQLSPLGEQQATHLGAIMGRRIAPFDAVFLGSMQRHKQTAIHCLQGFSQPFQQSDAIVDARWNEYDHQDILRQFRPEFLTAKSMMSYIHSQEDPKKTFETDFNNAINRWMSGEYDDDYTESWRVFAARIHSALSDIVANNPDKKNMAVFTSGGPISLVSQYLLGVPQEKLMQMNWTLVNCGVTKVVSTGSRLFISSLNEHTHFEGADNKHFITYT